MTDLAGGAHLTTSRVNRLLRPLRNKCNTLAALPKSAMAPRATYSKQPSHWDPDSRPPLTLLCASAGTKKLTLDRWSADEFELSRRIHAVCDAFKNIVHVAYGQPCARRVPSLAVMCTLVIGKNMHVADSDSSLVDSGEESTDEKEQLDVDGIYEAVPPHYRRFLIVSHALSIILCVCTPHHTLVTILLHHCLTFGLVHESTRLLNIVLAQAFLPYKSFHPPPATHPAHTNYLLDLHTKWTAGNKSSGASLGILLFTTSTFCHAVLGTLSQCPSCNSRILWTSKVLSRLFYAVENCDLDSYVTLTHTLSRNFWKISGSLPDATEDTQTVILRDRLSEMISQLFDLLFAQSGPRPSPLTPSRILAATDILSECYIARLHRLRISSPASPDLPDMIIIFATHLFVSTRSSLDNSDCILAILDDSSPVPTTFSKLMMYFSRLRDNQSFDDFIEAFLAQLRTYSSALRSEKLFSLDASLWACALRHFETSIAISHEGSPTLFTQYKQQLMEAVEVAERRCFGGASDSSPIVPLDLRSNRTKRSRLSGQWEWEHTVGSWIRSTVNPKATSGSIPTYPPLSTPACSPTSPSQPSETDGPDYADETDKENYYPSSPPPETKRRRPTKRQNSNFISLLADAQTNRIILHSKAPPEPKPPSSIIPEKYVPPLSFRARHAPHEQEQKASRSRAPLRTSSVTLLPSDDSLDLFVCATPSPARC